MATQSSRSITNMVFIVLLAALIGGIGWSAINMIEIASVAPH